MAESKMSISVNGQSKVPPGFRFHPTEEELLHYYLRKKVSSHTIDLDVITDVDLNKLEPWDIQERCKIGTTPQNDWYFFSHKDKKYPTGTRTNRATAAGFWKATGRDKAIYGHGKRIGMRKTLVFYKGRAPHGQKSDWIMHEYRLDDNITYNINTDVCSNVLGDATQGEEGWVVCRIFKKKNNLKTLNGPMTSSEITRSKLLNSGNNEGALDHILHYMGRTCKQENDNNNSNASNRFLGQIKATVNAASYQERFTMKLPNLESPNDSTSSQNCHQPNNIHQLFGNDKSSGDINSVSGTGLISNWAALDQLVASQLNGQAESSSQLACFSPYCTQPDDYHHDLNELVRSSSTPDNYNSEIDLWSFTRSSSSVIGDPSFHLSNTRS